MTFRLAPTMPLFLALAALSAASVVALTAGCSPTGGDASYTPRAIPEGVEVSAKHREQIAAKLKELYGEPLQPMWRVLAEKQPDDPKAKPAYADEAADRLELRHGREVYARQCSGCHGVTGDGQGPAARYLDPPPRDYRLGKFKFQSTSRGDKPRRSDLVRVIRHGAKGTSMPGFPWMSDEDLKAVIDYVKFLSSRGELEYRLTSLAEQWDEEDDLDNAVTRREAKRIADHWAAAENKIVRPRTSDMAVTEETIASGARAFVQRNCYKCHGADGRGNKEFNVGKDDWGRVAYAADLTGGMLHGGRRPIDIYRRVQSGINGTPMPEAFAVELVAGETAADRSDKIWHLTHFITAVVEGRPIPIDLINDEIRQQQSAAPEPTVTPTAPTEGDN